MSWSGGSKKGGASKNSKPPNAPPAEGQGRQGGPEMKAINEDIEMAKNGLISIPEPKFNRWRVALKKLPPEKKLSVQEDLKALMGRYFMGVGRQAKEAIAQLMVLIDDLSPPPAKAAKPSPKPSAPKSPAKKK